MKQRNTNFTECEIKETVTSCQNIIMWLTSTSLSDGIKYKQIDDNVRSLKTIECIFAYMYTEVGKYGNIADVIDTGNEIYARYTLAASLVFSEPKAMQECLDKLPVTWIGITNFVKGLAENEKEPAVKTLHKSITTIDNAIKDLLVMQIVQEKNEVWC